MSKKTKFTKQKADDLFEEFADLINPYAEDVPPGGAVDKDFEPKDPGWLYSDGTKEPQDPATRLDTLR